MEARRAQVAEQALGKLAVERMDVISAERKVAQAGELLRAAAEALAWAQRAARFVAPAQATDLR